MHQSLASFSFLLGAVVCEVTATIFLAKSEQFSKLVPSIIVIVGYVSSFLLLSFALKTIPIGLAYAVWAGLGIVLTMIIGVVLFGNKIDLPAIVGASMIISGVLIINLLSKASGH